MANEASKTSRNERMANEASKTSRNERMANEASKTSRKQHETNDPRTYAQGSRRQEPYRLCLKYGQTNRAKTHTRNGKDE